MIDSILQQLKKRRLELGLKQNDMTQRIGVSRQQYQHIESKGNPRLYTLSLIAKGLNSELILVPREKLAEVMALLNERTEVSAPFGNSLKDTESNKPADVQQKLSDDPMQDLPDAEQ